MPRLFSWFKSQSKTNRAEVADDISQVSIRNGPSSCDIFHKDTAIIIGQFLELKDLNNFARVDSDCFQLLFNRNLKRKDVLNIEYKKDESENFEIVQQLIWKPLVIHYFPKFGQQLNVKNWLHVLRRRIQHVKLKISQYTPIHTPSFVKTLEDAKFVENCEWVYECPLEFNKLIPYPADDRKRHCGGCNKDVYIVDNISTFEAHIGKGNCVAFSNKPLVDASLLYPTKVGTTVRRR